MQPQAAIPLLILVAHSTSADMAAAPVAAVAPRPPLLPPPASSCCANGKAACWSRSRNISQQRQHGGTCSLWAAARINNLLSTRGTQRSSSSSSCCGAAVATVASSFVGGKPKRRQVVVPEPDYRIPLVLLGLAGAFGYQDNLLVAAPIGLLGLLLLFQTTRVRFVFDDEALEVKVGDQLNESGENVFVGGKNCWKYSTFMNWEFWWPSFPVLVYFKETQTRPEGQVHFFPIIFNGKQLYNVMVERAGPSKTSGPKDS